MQKAYSQSAITDTLSGQGLLGLAYADAHRQTEARPRYFYLRAAAVVLVGLILRLWDVSAASLWTDESLTALRAQSPLRVSLDSIMGSGNQTPFYFMLMRLLPNETDLALRLPSVLLGTLGIALVIAVAVSLYGQYRLGMWAGILLAVNPFHVWLSRTARPYTLVFVLALVIAYLFLMMIRGRRSRLIWAGFIAASAAAYVTHYTLLALTGAQFVVLVVLLRSEVRFIKQWIAAQAVAVIPLLVWLSFLVRYPIEVGPDPEWVPVPTWEDIPLTLWNMTLGYDGAQAWFVGLGLMLAITGLVIGVLHALAERRSSPEGFFWMLLFLLPLGIVYGISTTIVSFYVDRYFMVFLPALLFLIPLGWQRISPAMWQLVLVVIVLLSCESILVTMRSGSYQRSDWHGVAEYLEREVRADDVLLLERDNQDLVFSRYFQPAEESRPQEVLLWNLTRDLSNTRVWAIYRNPVEDVHRFGKMPNFDPFDPALSQMGEWLAANRNYAVHIESFNGVKVIRLDIGQKVYAEAPSTPTP